MAKEWTITPEAVSWKNQSVKVLGKWLRVKDDINLKQFRNGLPITVMLEERFDHEWFILAIIKETIC